VSSIVILPGRNWCSIDGDARSVDCSAIEGLVRIMWDSDARRGAVISIDLVSKPINALPPGAADVIAAWSTAPPIAKPRTGKEKPQAG